MLAEAIDYAGLFPPAGLPMSQAVANYAAYREGRHAWALGRFVAPLARLHEFAAAPPSHPRSLPWRLSALAIGSGFADDIRRANAFNKRHHRKAVIDTLEFKGATPLSIEETASLADSPFVIFHEIPLTGDLRGFLTILNPRSRRAKIRTGGVTGDAFPEPAILARFLEQCAAAGVPFKATAGLHHSIRGQYPLTYEANSPKVTMHGFVNLFVAAAFARAGWNTVQLAEVLTEQSPSAFQFTPDNASWRGRQLPTDALRRSRSEFLVSFGSCSFEEPIHDLDASGWLPE